MPTLEINVWPDKRHPDWQWSASFPGYEWHVFGGITRDAAIGNAVQFLSQNAWIQNPIDCHVKINQKEVPVSDPVQATDAKSGVLMMCISPEEYQRLRDQCDDYKGRLDIANAKVKELEERKPAKPLPWLLEYAAQCRPLHESNAADGSGLALILRHSANLCDHTNSKFRKESLLWIVRYAQCLADLWKLKDA